MRLSGMLAIVAAAALAGCNSPSATSPADVAGRLKAAQEMNNVSQRDDALAAVAKDAAAAGEGDVTAKALGAMNNVAKKDDAAEDCAVALARAGKAAAAVQVAKLINNVAKRDAVLAKVAKGG